jgi:class 3 adenylate cyclase
LRVALTATGRALSAGLHIGECERHGDRLSGPAVEVAPRLGGLAARDEILVTRTVVDLVAGSGPLFELAAKISLEGPAGPIEVSALRALKA